MTHDTLALFGGRPTIEEALPTYVGTGEAETAAVMRVMRSGKLSSFYGSWGDQFLGGQEVQRFEREWAALYGVAHAVSVNSATSGLIAAMGAIGLGPGDEVIVPPFTMSATVVAPLFYGAIPVFVDIEATTFCIDVEQVRRRLTPRTRAIVAVDLFGHPAELARLRALADERGIWLIEDAAQATLAREGDRFAGTVGHIGIYSLNYHKHIHTGEGGMCVTDDARLAQRLQMIRNHAESIVEPAGVADLTNMIGFNFRLTELLAAIGSAQLASVSTHVEARTRIAARLNSSLEDLDGLTVPLARKDCEHAYYLWAFKLDEARSGCSREAFSRALAAEGVPHFVGYTRPLYLLPAFQRRIAIGRSGFPFALSDVSYEAGSCPVAERMWDRELICFEICMYDLDDRRTEDIIRAVRKVHARRADLAAGTAPHPG